MEFDVIENELAAMERQIKVLTNPEKRIELSGCILDVNDFIQALANLQGHVEVAKMAIARMKGEDV